MFKSYSCEPQSNEITKEQVVGVWYKQEKDALILNVYVQPGSKRTEIVGFYGDALKIRLSSAPIDGRANGALLKYVAQLFNVPLRQVKIRRGDKSRHKKIAITGSLIDPLSICEFVVENDSTP